MPDLGSAEEELGACGAAPLGMDKPEGLPPLCSGRTMRWSGPEARPSLGVGDGCPKISCHHGAQGGAYFQQGDAQTWSVVPRGPHILYTTALLPGLWFGDSS